MTKRRQRFLIFLLPTMVVVAIGVWYVRSHPLVFNESLLGHAHCMPQAYGTLMTYASTHAGRFPYHTNGYGDALLLMANEMGPSWGPLTGPGYDSKVFNKALRNGGHIPEQACGRVYVQGLSETNNPEIAVFFDKVAAPPDHCHFPTRLWQEFAREVCFLDGSWRPVPAAEWSDFVHRQVELLVAEGFSRAHAQQLYDQVR